MSNLPASDYRAMTVQELDRRSILVGCETDDNVAACTELHRRGYEYDPTQARWVMTAPTAPATRPTPEDQQARIAAIRDRIKVWRTDSETDEQPIELLVDVEDALDALASAPAAPPSPCEWRDIGDAEFYLNTPGCDPDEDSWPRGTVIEWKHCPYCGKTLVLAEVPHV